MARASIRGCQSDGVLPETESGRVWRNFTFGGMSNFDSRGLSSAVMATTPKVSSGCDRISQSSHDETPPATKG